MTTKPASTLLSRANPILRSPTRDSGWLDQAAYLRQRKQMASDRLLLVIQRNLCLGL
jgi:hypothetical protein